MIQSSILFVFWIFFSKLCKYTEKALRKKKKEKKALRMGEGNRMQFREEDTFQNKLFG